jgi:hypothetical protein
MNPNARIVAIDLSASTFGAWPAANGLPEEADRFDIWLADSIPSPSPNRGRGEGSDQPQPGTGNAGSKIWLRPAPVGYGIYRPANTQSHGTQPENPYCC